MDVLSLVVFLVLIILAFIRKLNIGVLAFGAAMILGGALGISDKAIIGGFNSSLFVTLVGITLLFAAVNSTKAFELVSNKIIRLAGKRIWVLPIVTYILGFILAVIGPGAIPPTTLVVTLAVSIAVASGYNPIMMSVIGVLGLMGGRAAAYTPEGVLITSLAQEQGLTSGVIPPVFAFSLITTSLMAIALYVVYKGYKVKQPDLIFEATEGASKNQGSTLVATEVKASKNQIIALLAVLCMLIAVVVFSLNVGLVSFLIVSVLFFFNIADDNLSIKSVPWGTIIMIGGVGILMSVVTEAGGIALLTEQLSKVMSSSTVAPFSGVSAGLMSLVASGLGVVYPTMIPMASELVTNVGGGNAVSVIAAIVAGGSMAGFSPMSTAGALTLGTMVTIKGDMTKEEQNKSFMQLLIIAVSAIIWVGVSAAIFSNLLVSIFG
ncbi:MAG: SLC13 family permease [Sedimentibacter sp.]